MSVIVKVPASRREAAVDVLMNILRAMPPHMVVMVTIEVNTGETATTGIVVDDGRGPQVMLAGQTVTVERYHTGETVVEDGR